MNEKLEKLNQEIEKTEARLRRAQHKEKMLEHQIKTLNRKERTHRLCTRGAMLESHLPHPEPRHMITLEVQKQCFVGFKGERFRFFLSDEGYRNAKSSEQEGEIKIKSHAAVVAGKLYPDKKPKQQER